MAFADRSQDTGPSAMEEFFFDLRGYTVLQALSATELNQINGWIDSRRETIKQIMQSDRVDYMPREPSQSLGGMQIQSYHNGEQNAHIGHADDGINLQFPYEAGPPFEALIDHPSFIGRVQHYLGQSQPYLHELFINLRGSGGYIGCHGGGPQFISDGTQLRSPWGAAAFRTDDTSHDPHTGTHRGHHVTWNVPYLSIIIALSDIGHGDGATVCIPSSHKSMVGHPIQQQMVTEGSAVEGGIEMLLKAGEALIFQDSLIHGATARKNPDGWRRTLCFRYLPQEAALDRFGYTPSAECMARLSPRRRELLTQRADVNDPWGQAHLKLVSAAEGKALPYLPNGRRPQPAAGHSYSKL